ncbi:hypothetical protein [Microbacterium foliorum]|uniref:hypothetical protein n=1 Tax=Microbacterium foliorum TaxID=104336 RepID=UPI001E142781|nr:hypothetical protein [Microbacterium foliorum]CAH0138045.1 hypothetical protein SRABI03_00443 [Microbacterium foliorum]CAH0208979.1 hypothetical protein SRABI44_02120 [Microbacterium foliorum]
MQIQFDPFSFIVAVIAVIVSGRAYYLSKKLPHLERVRENRDVVRAALRAVIEPLRSLRSDLDDGRDVEEMPEAIETAVQVLDEYGPRLPEHGELWIMGRAFHELHMNWRSAAASEKRVQAAEDEVALWEAELVKPDQSGNARDVLRRNLVASRTHRTEVRRTIDAARGRLEGSIEKALARSQAYVRAVDEADRRGTQ